MRTLRVGLLALIFVGCGGSSGPIPNSIPPVPAALLKIEQAQPTKSIYVSAAHACPNSTLNDGSVDACNGSAGPFASFSEIVAAAPQITPGTAVILRAGTYPVTNIGLSQEGTENAPIQLLAYPGETPVLDGGFHGNPADYVKDRISVIASGKYLVVRGIQFEGCHRTCLLVRGEHVVVADNIFIGGQEDSLKTSVPNSDVYIARNKFSMPAGVGANPNNSPEALDGFQSRRVWVTQNEFSDSDVTTGGWGSVAWFKAGSRHAYFYENNIHDVRVKTAATIMGGCCYSGWTWQPNTPIASDVVFENNTFDKVSFDNTSYRYRGAIVSSGCHGCLARNNTLTNCEAGFAVHDTEAAGEPVPDELLISTDVAFKGNTVSVTGAGHLFTVERESGLVVEDNTYTCNKATFIYKDQPKNSAEWQALGFDVNSQLCP